jgi:hypothetical protein
VTVIEVAIGPGAAPGMFKVEVVASSAGEVSATVGLAAQPISSWAVPARCVASLLARLPSARRQPGTACAAGTWIGHHWQGPGLRDAPSARCCQHRVKPVMRVRLQIERQVQRCYHFVLKLPRPVADDPAHVGILRHPGRQQLLAFNEGQAVARSHTPQLKPQLATEQAAQRPTQRRALRVACVVVSDPCPETLPTSRAAAIGALSWG